MNLQSISVVMEQIIELLLNIKNIKIGYESFSYYYSFTDATEPIKQS